MGSPTSDDDPPRRVPPPGSWGLGGPPHQHPGPPQGPPPEQHTTPLAQPPADAQRGHTAPFPQPGGPYPPGGAYPPPSGPGGPGPYPPPGPYGPGGPPQDGGRNRRGLVIALAAGLVILAGVAVALVFAFTRDDGRTVSADPTASPSAGSSSSSSSAPSSSPSPSESTSSAPSTTADNAGDRTDELLAVVPADFTDCTETDLAGDGDVAAVACGASSTQPGPETAYFYLYEDSQTLDQVFVQDVEAEGIDPMPEGANCNTAQGVTTWDVDGVEGGNLACTIGSEGVLIAWTDREFGIEAVVTASGTTQEELAALADWWRANSDYQR